MKFLMVLCLLALSVAEEEDTQEKKSQIPENTQNTNAASPQNNQQFNQPFFPPASLFGNKDAVSAAPFSGFSGNIPNIQNIPVQPIQPLNPEFFSASQGVINNALPNFQLPRVLPGASPVASGIQSQFPSPVAGGIQSQFPSSVASAIQSQFPISANVLSSIPAVVNGVSSHFPNLGGNILPSVAGLQAISPESLKYQSINAGVPIVSGSPYRVLPQENLANFPIHNLQTPQNIIPAGLSSIQNYPSTILPSLPNGILSSAQGLLKTPTATSQSISNISNLPTDKINAAPIASVFRHA